MQKISHWSERFRWMQDLCYMLYTSHVYIRKFHCDKIHFILHKLIDSRFSLNLKYVETKISVGENRMFQSFDKRSYLINVYMYKWIYKCIILYISICTFAHQSVGIQNKNPLTFVYFMLRQEKDKPLSFRIY